MAKILAGKLKIPAISKDSIKEVLFDNVGFQSREEKVKLGVASMEIMYYAAKQLMEAGQPFILENNFEYSSERGIVDTTDFSKLDMEKLLSQIVAWKEE